MGKKGIITTGPNVIKKLHLQFMNVRNKLVLVPGKPLQPCLMFASKEK